MKIILFLLMLSSNIYAQDISGIKLATNQGSIYIDQNYINTERLGIQRIKMKNLYPSYKDMFAWIWEGNGYEFRFKYFGELRPPKTMLVKRKIKSKKIEYIEILSYTINYLID